MTGQEYECAEAFCIMTYQCKRCQKTEEVYNPRDGVTPFSIDCRYCGESANHINWRADMRAPDFKPFIGMRVFTEFSPGRARERAKEMLARYEGTEYEIPKGTEEYDVTLRSMTQNLVNDCCAVELVPYAEAD